VSTRIGAYVVDLRTEKVWLVVGGEGPGLRLRPVGWGRVRVCAPGDVRAATVHERMSAATAYANARSRGEVP
jgi:hypothetical protein